MNLPPHLKYVDRGVVNRVLVTPPLRARGRSPRKIHSCRKHEVGIGGIDGYESQMQTFRCLSFRRGFCLGILFCWMVRSCRRATYSFTQLTEFSPMSAWMNLPPHLKYVEARLGHVQDINHQVKVQSSLLIRQ